MKVTVGALVLGATATIAASCGGRNGDPSFAECVGAWNAADNAPNRERVRSHVIAPGHSRAGVQLSDSLGLETDNPTGCRVVFFNDHDWFAYLASRHGDHFDFRDPTGQIAHQHGVWPPGARPGPNNARVSASARLSLREEGTTQSAATPAWLREQGRRYLRVYVGDVQPREVNYLLGHRFLGVVYHLRRSVECLACSPPSIATRPRTREVEFAFDAKTHRLGRVAIRYLSIQP